MAYIFTSVPASVCVICYGESTPGLLHKVQDLYYSKMYENSDYFRLLVFQSIRLEEALVHGYDSEVRLAHPILYMESRLVGLKVHEK